MKAHRILIAGPSCSGKTTLAVEYAKATGIQVFSLDSFRSRTKRYVQINGVEWRDYENPDCWHGRAFAQMLATQQGPFIAEGTCLFRYREVIDWLDADRYYVDVPFAVSLERRRARARNKQADETFAATGENGLIRWVEPQKLIPYMRILDGLMPTAELLKIIAASP